MSGQDSFQNPTAPTRKEFRIEETPPDKNAPEYIPSNDLIYHGSPTFELPSGMGLSNFHYNHSTPAGPAGNTAGIPPLPPGMVNPTWEPTYQTWIPSRDAPGEVATPASEITLPPISTLMLAVAEAQSGGDNEEDDNEEGEDEEDEYGDDDDDEDDDYEYEYEVDEQDEWNYAEYISSGTDIDETGHSRHKLLRRRGNPRTQYPHPLDGIHAMGRTLTFKEQYVRAFSAGIRNKPDWTRKILDRKLFAKWLREAQSQKIRVDSDPCLMWDKEDVAFVYKELTEIYKPFVEELRDRGLTLEPDIDGVWRDDSLIDEELRQQLIDAVATLENVPEEKKDYHPGTKKQVLDLVHPSLWPVIYDRSINLVTGEPISPPKASEEDRIGYSSKFCWLPSEFTVSSDGKSTSIDSYINNLASSQEQKDLFYPILEKIFTKSVPLFNHVLGDLKCKKHELQRVFARAGLIYWDEDMIKLSAENHNILWEKLLSQFENNETLDVNFYQKMPLPRSAEDGEGDDDDSSDSDDDEYFERNNIPWVGVKDNMGRFVQEWTPPYIAPAVSLEGKTVKVIVKMANILLTPEQPKYKGGSWHVEAMLNERIISTGIYYYDQENITDSNLGFRRTLNNIPQQDELNQSSDWRIVFNMSDWEARSVQSLGQIQTKKNRAIAFPNIFQHQVQPFELQDPTKPGYRKILVFFLCDPDPVYDIPSTKIVAQQQPEFRDKVEDELRKGPMGNMPEEIFSMVTEKLPEVVTREEAEKYRTELMKERGAFMRHSTMVKGISFTFCEH